MCLEGASVHPGDGGLDRNDGFASGQTQPLGQSPDMDLPGDPQGQVPQPGGPHPRQAGGQVVPPHIPDGWVQPTEQLQAVEQSTGPQLE